MVIYTILLITDDEKFSSIQFFLDRKSYLDFIKVHLNTCGNFNMYCYEDFYKDGQRLSSNMKIVCHKEKPD